MDFVSSSHKCLTRPWRHSGCCALSELRCDLSLLSLMTFTAHPKSSSHFPVLFFFPLHRSVSHFPGFPLSVPSLCPPPCIPVLWQTCWCAVFTIWAGQLLQSLEPPDPHWVLEHSHPITPSFLLFSTCAASLLATARSAQLRKTSKAPPSQGSNPSAGKPHPDGFTPSPPSSAPCGTKRGSMKNMRTWKLSM